MRKKYFNLVLIGLVNYGLYAQTTTANNNYIANQDKFLGFNASNGVNPLFTRTNNINRLRLNGIQTIPISGYAGQNTSGYLGLGATGPTLGGSPVFNYFVSNSPLSMFHLNGRNGAFVQTAGYRPWMQTGVTYTDNQDFLCL